MKLPFEAKQTKVLVKKESEGELGINPKERSTEELVKYGVVNIDKPSGPSSHQVSAYVKQMLGIGKSGHSGTLDPAVTGVLPVALGRGTRITHALLTAGKEYIGIIHLHDDIKKEKIFEVIEEFKGKITQLPPVRSAVVRKHRVRKVYYFEVIDVEGRDILFRVGTQAGTYIRKLCHDIGERLQCGAHMQELRRTKAGPFNEKTLCTLHDLRDAYKVWKEENNEEPLRKLIQPLETGISHLPKIWVLDSTVKTLCNGASLKIPGISKLDNDIRENDMVAVLTLKGELVMTGVAQTHSKEMMNAGKGIAVIAKQVMMNPQ